MGLLHRFVFIALVSAATSAHAAQLTCESQGTGRTACPANLGGSVELLTQLSGAPCIEGRTWGTDRSGIWVSDGCRAVFKAAAAPAGAASPASGQSAQWQRGFADGQRGAYDEHSHPRDYREGYKEGEQAALNSDAAAQSSESDARNPSDDEGSTARDDERSAAQDSEPSDEPDEPLDEPRDEEREATTTRAPPPDALQRACVEQASLGEPYGPDQVFVGERRGVGNGVYELDLDTPDGPLVCTVDRGGNVRSIDEP